MSGCELENFLLCGATDSSSTYYVVAYEKDLDVWMVVCGLMVLLLLVLIKLFCYVMLKLMNYLFNVNVV